MNKDDGARVVRRHGRHQARRGVQRRRRQLRLDVRLDGSRAVRRDLTSAATTPTTGIEADNNEFNNELLPRANPTIYNITICGDPDRNEGAESPRGVLFRRGTAVTFRNFLITGFKSVGMQIDGASTLDQAAHGNAGGRRRHLGRGRPTARATLALIPSGRFPNVGWARTAGDGRLLQPRGPDVAPPRWRRWPAVSSRRPAAQRRVLRRRRPTSARVPPPPGDDWTQGWTRSRSDEP